MQDPTIAEVPPPKPRLDPLLGPVIRMLALRRSALGISQRHMDEVLGCAEGLVAKWENGSRQPTGFNLACYALGVGARLVIDPLAPPSSVPSVP